MYFRISVAAEDCLRHETQCTALNRWSDFVHPLSLLCSFSTSIEHSWEYETPLLITALIYNINAPVLLRSKSSPLSSRTQARNGHD